MGDREAARFIETGATRFVRYPVGPGRAALRRYVEATGARELAVANASGEGSLELVRGLGITVYRLGPPRQISLFSGAAAARPAAAV